MGKLLLRVSAIYNEPLNETKVFELKPRLSVPGFIVGFDPAGSAADNEGIMSITISNSPTLGDLSIGRCVIGLYPYYSIGFGGGVSSVPSMIN